MDREVRKSVTGIQLPRSKHIRFRTLDGMWYSKVKNFEIIFFEKLPRNFKYACHTSTSSVSPIGIRYEFASNRRWSLFAPCDLGGSRWKNNHTTTLFILSINQPPNAATLLRLPIAPIIRLECNYRANICFFFSCSIYINIFVNN